MQVLKGVHVCLGPKETRSVNRAGLELNYLHVRRQPFCSRNPHGKSLLQL